MITAASPLALSKAIARKCVGAGVPVVLFNRYFADIPVASVSCDNALGGALAAETLLAARHRRFAFIGGPEPTSADADRCAGFVARLRERGAAPPLIETMFCMPAAMQRAWPCWRAGIARTQSSAPTT